MASLSDLKDDEVCTCYILQRNYLAPPKHPRTVGHDPNKETGPTVLGPIFRGTNGAQNKGLVDSNKGLQF